MGSGMCGAQVCKLNDDICQIRLDFETFVISGPSTITTSIGDNMFGVTSGSTASGTAVSLAGNCLTDTFTVSNTNGVPVLCGDLADDHRKDLLIFFRNIGRDEWKLQIPKAFFLSKGAKP